MRTLILKVCHIGEERSGISSRTGEPWKSRNINATTLDDKGGVEDGFAGVVFNNDCDALVQQQIGIGTMIKADVSFRIESRNGYNSTRVDFRNIAKV